MLTTAEASSAAAPIVAGCPAHTDPCHQAVRTAVVNADGVHYRMAPGTNFIPLGVVPRGTVLKYVETVDGYASVNCGNGTKNHYWVAIPMPGKPGKYADISGCFVNLVR